jgi:hypothetical protein
LELIYPFIGAIFRRTIQLRKSSAEGDLRSQPRKARRTSPHYFILTAQGTAYLAESISFLQDLLIGMILIGVDLPFIGAIFRRTILLGSLPLKGIADPNRARHCVPR